MLDEEDVQDLSGGQGELDEPEAAMPVVGVGVCAVSLRSLETLFGDIAPGLGAAYLIAVRQQEGLDVGTVVEVLTRQSDMPVSIAEDGERIRADHIYIGGPEEMISLDEGRLRVRPAVEPIGHRGTIDTMLISLAEHAHDRSIAVLLSGLGNDGTAGITATKKFGGLSIAEAEAREEQKSSPDTIGAMGVVDLHIPIDQMADQIALYLRNLGDVAEGPDKGLVDEDVEAQVTQITTVLRNVLSHDFHGYKRGTFLRRVHRRLQVLQIETLDEYIARLRSDQQEVQDLFQDLLIGVTKFFRDPQEFEVLERELPRLFEGKGPEDQLRVWVLGCATGEEAYSIAILLREHMATLDHPPQVQIFATDLDSRALGLARAGRYSLAIEDQVRADRLKRWFVREGDTYCVTKELREMCIFSPHNLVKDAPFSRIDILSCRNLLIYLNVELQNRVIPIFHFSLQPGGVLFLGNSENITRHQKLFTPVDRRNRVFRRLESATRVIPDFPLSPRVRTPDPVAAPTSAVSQVARLSAAVTRQAEAIAERYAPAYVVVDVQGDVLHFSGRTGRFLEPVAGIASLNIVNLVHRDLRVDLRTALHRALSDGRRVELPRLIVQNEDRALGVNLVVEPVGAGEVTSLVILFQDIGPVPAQTAGPERPEDLERLEKLDTELRMTRDRLQTTIEELESTNEELKSSNEEYQSINEELQSANEEMETSKEELQSVNEELQTVNGELAHRVADLGRSNSDLKNLLEATQIATLFLDNDLRVRSFTPTATEIFHLLETDVGRPLGHVVSRVDYPELQEDVRRVLKSLVPTERMVVDTATQRHFAVKVLPYRSIDNYISGAVVTFTDLTAVRLAQSALRESEERLQALLAASAQSIYRMNADWSEMIHMAGRHFLADTERSSYWLSQHIPADEQPRVTAAIKAAIESKQVFELEHRVRQLDGSIGWTSSRAVPICSPEGEIIEWFGAAQDITGRREAEEAVRESKQRLSSLTGALTQLVWRADPTGQWTWANRQWSDYTGQSDAESSGAGWLDPVHPDDRATAREAWSRAAIQGGFEIEIRILNGSDDVYRWFQVRARPVRDDRGAIIEWIGSASDIDELHELQQRQGVLVAELQHRTRNLIGVVRQVAQKTARGSADLADFRNRFRDRLEALARVQGLLSRLNEHDRVTFDELLLSELAAHGVDPDVESRIALEGPSGVRLRSSTVQTLAMALHELATNAVKYGALGQADAQLAVRWYLSGGSGTDGPWLHIDWQETNVTMPQPNTMPPGGGQGRELIERALPYQLGAKTTYVLEPDGVRCMISVLVSATINSEDDDG